MAKPPVPGLVKTRLTASLSPAAAAAVHAAMMQCVLNRLTALTSGPCWLALAGLDEQYAGDAELARLRLAELGPLAVHVPKHWRIVDQGSGDLGSRLNHVWQQVHQGKAVFWGVDSPDVPQTHLQAALALTRKPVCGAGPVSDGGYWTLAAGRYCPEVVADIDWAGPSVYHQTQSAAAAAGIKWQTLPRWHDVDEPADLSALMQRLDAAVEPALVQLKHTLGQTREEPSP